MSEALKSYSAWSPVVRWFHWINFLSVISLIFVGLIMMYKKDLGITSLEAKVALKTLHVVIGYVFATNLLIRLLMAFFGPSDARFNAFIPQKGFMQTLNSYFASLRAGNPQQFVGHNPLGRVAVTMLFSLMIVLAVTGLIRAGTDIYYPPFGSMVTSYIAQDGVDPASLIPYQDQGVDPDKKKALKAFKSPYGKVHYYTALILMIFIVMHISAVILTEVREGGNLISAMFNGKKFLSKQPLDK